MTLEHHKDFQFLVDVNLPRKFNFFNTENFLHVVDINPRMSDSEIWEYALSNNKIILTKDSDFYDRFMNSIEAPKIIYFQLGNLKLKELNNYLESNWNLILSYLENASLILARREHVKVII